VAVAARILRDGGHTVENCDPPYPGTLLQQWGRSWLAGIAQEVDALRLDVRDLEPRTAAMVGKGARITRRGGPAPGAAAAWRERATRWFAGRDLLLTPVVARRPGAAGALTGRGYLRTYLAAARAVPFTQAWNLAGFPAVTVPVGVRDGLPLVVQLIGPTGAEPLLLGVAAQLERSIRPPMT
jgi:amidase